MTTSVELAQRVERLTVKHLETFIRTLAITSSNVNVDEEYLIYGLATEVLRFFFGNQWTNENIFAMHKQVSSRNRIGRGFLKTESTDTSERFRHMQRVTSLAELAFNMQGIEGLKARIERMQKDNLESALGEMECAALLSSPEFNFRFVTPTGIKGQDYEGEVITSTERIVCCEIKSKSEQVVPNPDTLWRTFDQARKQLPKGKPGLIMVKIPESWGHLPSSPAVVDNAVEKVFRQSERIVAIVFTWEEWFTTVESWRVVVNKIKHYSNARSSLYGDDVEILLNKMGRKGNPLWVIFHDLVEQVSR